MPKPLLVVDGDSFARRAYQTLPKMILARRQGAAAVLGSRHDHVGYQELAKRLRGHGFKEMSLYRK